MRAKPVTYEEVAAICDALSDLGIEPTQLKIISLLKRGSNTTINNHLSEWKKQPAKTVKLRRSIIRSIEAEIEGEASRLSADAQEQLFKAQQAADEQLARAERLQRELDKLDKEQRHTDLRHDEALTLQMNQLNALQGEYDRLRRKGEAQEGELKHAIADAAAYKLRCADLEIRLNAANDEVSAVRQEKEASLLEIGSLRNRIEQLLKGAQEC